MSPHLCPPRLFCAATPQGVPNNLEFLRAVVADPRFIAGDTTTRFLEDFHFVPHVAEVLVPGGFRSAIDPRDRWAGGSVARKLQPSPPL